jgi:hypothetical protein
VTNTITEPNWKELGLEPVPELCQQTDCRRPVQTWCPLCGLFLCDYHDLLTPVRCHDCLSGKAEVSA